MSNATEHIAQAELHRRVHDRLRGYLINLRATPQEADDLVGEAFVVAIRKWTTRPCGKEDAWIYGIARKKLMEHQRARGRSLRSLTTGAFVIEPAAGVHEQYEASEQFSRLTPAEQEVIHLMYIARLTPEDVAGLLGTSVSAIYERLRSARTRIAKGELDVA